MTSSRRHHLKVRSSFSSWHLSYMNFSDSLVDYCLYVFFLQSLLLQIAHGLLEEESAAAEEEKQRYMEENCPNLSLPGSMQELQVHTKIEIKLHKAWVKWKCALNLYWPSDLCDFFFSWTFKKIFSLNCVDWYTEGYMVNLRTFCRGVEKRCVSLCVCLCVKELCRKMHQQIDMVDEQRYDMETKVAKSDKEVNLN